MEREGVVTMTSCHINVRSPDSRFELHDYNYTSFIHAYQNILWLTKFSVNLKTLLPHQRGQWFCSIKRLPPLVEL